MNQEEQEWQEHIEQMAQQIWEGLMKRCAKTSHIRVIVVDPLCEKDEPSENCKDRGKGEEVIDVEENNEEVGDLAKATIDLADPTIELSDDNTKSDESYGNMEASNSGYSYFLGLSPLERIDEILDGWISELGSQNKDKD